MKLKKILGLQNAQITKEFNNGTGFKLVWHTDYSRMLNKYLSEDIWIRQEKYNLILESQKCNWGEGFKITLKIRLQAKQHREYSWEKEKWVRKLEIVEEDKKYLDWDVKDIIKLFNQEAKKYNQEKENKELKDFNDFKSKLNKHNLTYEDFNYLKSLERKVDYDYLEKLK